LSEHNRKKGKYTDKGIPWKLVYIENYVDKASAEKREKEIKSQKSRKYIENLLHNLQ
jgi:putative endonuclease